MSIKFLNKDFSLLFLKKYYLVILLILFIIIFSLFILILTQKNSSSPLSIINAPSISDSSNNSKLCTLNPINFAAIGDYGKNGENEKNVANLVKSWKPEFIITLGDNNYESGEESTIDENIGKYYSEYIYPYKGKYSSIALENKFFPSLGNHDWVTKDALPYINYFTLPNNERYYDFIKEDMHFFVLDSQVDEPDGTNINSIQANWLKKKLTQAPETWKIVYFHHSPYSSSKNHGSTKYMQWPFKEWGANAILSGHDHDYERLLINNLIYFVNGLGGDEKYDFGNPIEGSQLRYNQDFGAIRINADKKQITFEFIDTLGNIIDKYEISNPNYKC